MFEISGGQPIVDDQDINAYVNGFIACGKLQANMEQ